MSTKLPISSSIGERLAEFMRKVAGQTYPEPVSDIHTQITRKVLDELIPKLPADAVVLDVGCGQGPALKIFKEHGINVRGIALNDEDVRVCLDAGYIVIKMDQNDLQFADGTFDLVWARHVLEHSIAPLWTLTEFWRVLKPDGWLYAEMPAPDTACCHETNQNHYSVLGARAWYYLLRKAGFKVMSDKLFKLDTRAGPDTYFSFTARKEI